MTFIQRSQCYTYSVWSCSRGTHLSPFLATPVGHFAVQIASVCFTHFTLVTLWFYKGTIDINKDNVIYKWKPAVMSRFTHSNTNVKI